MNLTLCDMAVLSVKRRQVRHIDELTGTEFIAYKSNGNGHACVFRKFKDGKYGFINLGYVNSNVSFVADSFTESVTNAGRHREVHVFDTYKELVGFIVSCQ